MVVDLDGNFWTVSRELENPWEERQPFLPKEATELEPVPGHSKNMLGLPPREPRVGTPDYCERPP
jgi:hypothetical protein